MPSLVVTNDVRSSRDAGQARSLKPFGSLSVHICRLVAIAVAMSELGVISRVLRTLGSLSTDMGRRLEIGLGKNDLLAARRDPNSGEETVMVLPGDKSLNLTKKSSSVVTALAPYLSWQLRMVMASSLVMV